MTTTLSPNSQAIIMFTSALPGQSADLSPLSAAEWSELSQWLDQAGKEPGDLISPRRDEVLAEWAHPSITTERLQALSRRGFALALSMEKWSRVGIWTLTLDDEDYPEVIKARLEDQAPPVIYGVGNKSILRAIGIGIAVAQEYEHLTKENEAFAKDVGAFCAEIRIPIGSPISLDQTPLALTAALQEQGQVIGAAQNQLLALSLQKQWRSSLMGDQSVLISTNHPETPADQGRVEDLRLLYALASSITIVTSPSPFSDEDLPRLSNAIHAFAQGWAALQISEEQGSDEDYSVQFSRLIELYDPSTKGNMIPVATADSDSPSAPTP